MVFGRPAELFPQIHAVRPNVFPDWQQFVNRYCGGHQDRWGNASGCSNEAELYEKRLFCGAILNSRKEFTKTGSGPT